MALRCEECNILFDSQQLYETHKRKFCVGSSVDPSGIHSRISGTSRKRNIPPGEDFSLLPEIKTPVYSSLSAPSTPYRPKNPLPESERSLNFLGGHHHKSAPSTPRNPDEDQRDISALEREKIEQLKRFKMQQQQQRSARNLDGKHLLNGSKDLSQIPTRMRLNSPDILLRDEGTTDDRVLQLTENHRQQLSELKLRNDRLKDEKAKITERMNALGLRSGPKVLSQGSVRKQTEELDGLKRFLDFKKEEERKVGSQPSKVNVLRVAPRSPPHSSMSARSANSSLLLPRRTPREQERQRLDQLLPYHQSPQRYVDQAPGQFGQNSILHELNTLRNEYFQKGGNDPAILAQMQGLEFEAQRLQANQRQPPPAAEDPLLQQQIMSFQMANQRLEQELQLLKEERNLKERVQSPDVDPELKRLKEEHMVKIATLRQEAELLKQQTEVEKMKKELKDLRGEKPLLEVPQKSLGSPFMMSDSTADRELLPSPYDPNAGFAVFWDFILGLSESSHKCRLAAGIYQGTEIVTDVKLLPLVGTTLITNDSHTTVPPGRVAVIGVKHPFPRCLPDQSFSLVVELQANNAEDSTDPEMLFSKGWTKIDLFDMSNRLLSGRWKIPFRISPIKAFLNTYELNKIPQVGQGELYIRLVNSRDVTAQDASNPQPMQRYLYKYPPVENVRVLPPVQAPASIQGDSSPAPPQSVPSTSQPTLPSPDNPLSSVQRSESNPRTPLEDSFFGFQVDKLMNAIPGEARIKVAVYDRGEGQVLKGGNNSPVMCVTKSAVPDFLEGIYSFGLQEAKFRNTTWDSNSIVVFRLYLQPNDVSSTRNATAQAGNLLDESKLAAWTALPLALTVRSSYSRRSQQSQDRRSGSLRLNVGLHDVPLFFPPVSQVPNIPLRGAIPEQWTPYGQASLRVSIFSSTDPAPERPSSPEEFVHENDLPENVWIKNGRSSILTKEFEEGNGFDVYIDGARFLPNSVTISKVAGRVLDKNYTRIGSEIDVQAELDSDIYNPEYNARLEYREPVFPPSSILMLKVYTVESISKSLRCVGFAIIPIFLEVGTTKQPEIGASQGKVALNEGPHQVRLFGGSPDLTQPLHANIAQHLSPVPCASLLVRIVQAACHPNGRPKEGPEFKETEWKQEGLFQPKPNYADGAYYSLSCEPTLGENQIFHSMVKRQVMKTRDAIKLIGDGKAQKLKKDKVIESWIKTRLTRNMDSLPGELDTSYVALYHVMHGLKISVDAAMNLPWTNFTMATYCLSPPGSFYRGQREDPLNFTTTPLYSSTIASPVWRQGMKVFPRRIYHRYMVLIVHLYEIAADTSHNRTSLQGQAWTAVQVFNDGYVIGGSYLLPLYSGDPPEVVLNSLQSDTCVDVLSAFRRKKLIKYLEGSSVYVRLSDARRGDELPAPKINARQDYLPREKLEKYLTINPSSSLNSLVPRGMSEDELTAKLTLKFKTLTTQLLGSYQRDRQQQRT